MRVLITGASGFIGRHTVAHMMREGHVVRTVHRGAALPGVADHCRADVSSDDLAPALATMDAVIHLAGIGDVAESQRDPLRYNLVNAVGTLRVLEAARHRGAEVVMASTQHVYRPSSRRVTERSLPTPQNIYGASKLMAERWCEIYGRAYGLRARVLRLFSVYGPGQVGQGASGVVAIFTARALAGSPITVMSDQRRDFTHVDDVVRGISAALALPAPGHALFNIGTGIGTSFSSLARMIRALVGSDCAIDASSIARTTDHLVPSVELARKQLGFEARIPLQQGLREYCERTRTAALRPA